MRTIKYTNQVSLVFPSRSANESFARSAAAAFAAQLDPTLDELGDVKTAVSEAVTNAIVHAYPDTLGKVELKLRLYPGNELELIVRDWGVGIPDIEQARTLQLFQTGTHDQKCSHAACHCENDQRLHDLSGISAVLCIVCGFCRSSLRGSGFCRRSRNCQQASCQKQYA